MLSFFIPCYCILARGAGEIVAVTSRTSLHQSKGCYIIPQYKTTKNRLFIQVLGAAVLQLTSYFKSITWQHSPFFSKIFSSCIGPHKKGFWLFSAACDPSVLTEDKGNKGSGRFPGRSRRGWVGWVSDEGRLAGWWLIGRGNEALYGREVAWVAEEVGASWFRVSLGGSDWNGLVTEGALRPKQRETNRKKKNC